MTRTLGRFWPVGILVLCGISLLGCGSHHLADYNSFAIQCAHAELWNEAAFRWQQVLAIDPNHAPANNNLGVAYEALGQFDEAVTAYDRAIVLDPANTMYRINRSRCLSQKTNPHQESDTD